MPVAMTQIRIFTNIPPNPVSLMIPVSKYYSPSRESGSNYLNFWKRKKQNAVEQNLSKREKRKKTSRLQMCSGENKKRWGWEGGFEWVFMKFLLCLLCGRGGDRYFILKGISPFFFLNIFSK